MEYTAYSMTAAFLEEFTDEILAGRASTGSIDEWASEFATEFLDRTLVYTADIRTLWADLGEPEPEDMSAHDSISAAIYSATEATMIAEFMAQAPDELEAIRRAALDAWERERSAIVSHYSAAFTGDESENTWHDMHANLEAADDAWTDVDEWETVNVALVTLREIERPLTADDVAEFRD